jgi:mannosyl-oligosaccharide alpha-1,2-mannosidase
LRFIDTINFKKACGKIQLFEVTIRHFGGMLSALYVLNRLCKGLVTGERLKEAMYEQMVKLEMH